MVENNEYFNFTSKVDLHALDPTDPMENVAAVFEEHGFRTIVVGLGSVGTLDKLIKTDKNICAVIDYPFGNLSLDTRKYGIIAAKEAGAKEIEIVAPYHYLSNINSGKINEDIEMVVNTCNQMKIPYKYVVDFSLNFANEYKKRISKTIVHNELPWITTSLGFFDLETEDSDLILLARTIKSLCKCKIKTFVNTTSPESLANFIKAGIDLIGMDWDIAPNVVHGYEQLVNNEG